MQTVERTTEQWAAVVAQLKSKRKTALDQVAQLREQKENLAFESAMGSAEAKKKMEKVNADLARLTLESEDLDTAVVRAEGEQKKAEQSAAAAAEQQRQGKMSELAREVIREAAGFTIASKALAEAGNKTKAAVQAMLAVAKPGEQQTLDRLLAGGAYTRTAQAAGLRAHIDLNPYLGPPEHLGPLERELSAPLSLWLQPTSTDTAGKTKEASHGS